MAPPKNIPESNEALPQKPAAFRSSKLKSTLGIEDQAVKTVEEQSQQAVQDVYENKPFTEQAIKDALHAYGKKINKQSQQYIVKSDFDRKENQIILKLPNQTLLDLFEELRQEIVDFVRRYVSNNELNIEAVLTAEIKEAKPRTEQEKFKAMLEKNPALKDLKDELGLDLMY